MNRGSRGGFFSGSAGNLVGNIAVGSYSADGSISTQYEVIGLTVGQFSYSIAERLLVRAVFHFSDDLIRISVFIENLITGGLR